MSDERGGLCRNVGCVRKAQQHRDGMCNKCRKECINREGRAIRYNYPHTVENFVHDAIESARDGESGCIIWHFGMNNCGYGSWKRKGGVTRTAHRVIYEMVYGTIPDGLHIRHTCHNPACINVNHMELGTHSDNMQDKVIAGRQLVLSDRPELRRDKLTEEEILIILTSDKGRVELSELLGISQTSISSIRSGRTHTARSRNFYASHPQHKPSAEWSNRHAK